MVKHRSEMPWAYRPALYRETLEHFFTSREAMDIPCGDKKAVVALKHGLNRYYIQTAREAENGNIEAAKLAVVIPQIMVTNRETVVIVALRDERINIDFDKMAEAVSKRTEAAEEPLPEASRKRGPNSYY